MEWMAEYFGLRWYSLKNSTKIQLTQRRLEAGFPPDSLVPPPSQRRAPFTKKCFLPISPPISHLQLWEVKTWQSEVVLLVKNTSIHLLLFTHCADVQVLTKIRPLSRDQRQQTCRHDQPKLHFFPWTKEHNYNLGLWICFRANVIFVLMQIVKAFRQLCSLAWEGSTPLPGVKHMQHCVLNTCKPKFPVTGNFSQPQFTAFLSQMACQPPVNCE